MAIASTPAEIGIERCFTAPGAHPYDDLDWADRDALIVDHRTGEPVFEQRGVEFPVGWSTNASNIVAQKYFRGTLGSTGRERSLREVIDRVVDTICDWGAQDGYFADADEAAAFRDELTHLLVAQKAAFNSPVWFNIGVSGVPAQSSACFILAVEDRMESILEWYAEEGMIFKGGSGSGVNLSGLRSSAEPLAGGGTASGPVSFMRGADASAGTIKSGGKTRRAAKMVILDVDHPDVEEFIWCKAKEERKARALRAAGFDVDLDGADGFSLQYQNANNSVRVTDEFMQAVADDTEWELRAVVDGRPIRSVRARALFDAIAEAAWECADPGIQFDTTINSWHTTPNAGRINASNPCSEYMHLDNSACNLASLNLLRFLADSGEFDVDGFQAAVRIMITAQDILVSHSDYPTGRIGENARAYRQLGLGYTNLGALLMALGLPYDSDSGRALAGAATALMTGQAYETSARLAARLGPFDGFAADRAGTLAVIERHRAAVADVDEDLPVTGVREAAVEAWDRAVELAAADGVRNAQVSVLAPTGTISFMMDCDTTGIEPDLGLVKHKKLVGGGTMTIVNQTVPRALRRLGYVGDEITEIADHVAATGSAIGAPHLDPDHLPVFGCSMGDNPISPMGHVRMMAAVQPFLSGAISKTVNLPEGTSGGQIGELLLESWRLELKAVAVYRDNCKVAQPLAVAGSSTGAGTGDPPPAVAEAGPPAPLRRRLPRSRRSRTFEFRVADCKGFVTVGEYEDGRPGEIFVRVSKQGSTLAGIMDAFAIAVSHGLQYGVPLRAYVDAFIGMRFEPQGMTDDPDLRIASSLMDYLFRRLAIEYLSPTERAELHIFTTDERLQPTLPGVEESVTETIQGHDIRPDPPSPHPDLADRPTGSAATPDAPLCMNCGSSMVRAGSCFVCGECGSTSGCS